MMTTETDELKAFVVGNYYSLDGWEDCVLVAATDEDDARLQAIEAIAAGLSLIRPDDDQDDDGDGFRVKRFAEADRFRVPGRRGLFELTDEQYRLCGWMAADEDDHACDQCGLYAFGLPEHAVCPECWHCPTCRVAAMECDGCGEGLVKARRKAMDRLRERVGNLVGDKAWAWDYMSEPVSRLIQTLSPSTLRAMADDVQRHLDNHPGR